MKQRFMRLSPRGSRSDRRYATGRGYGDYRREAYGVQLAKNCEPEHKETEERNKPALNLVNEEHYDSFCIDSACYPSFVARNEPCGDYQIIKAEMLDWHMGQSKNMTKRILDSIKARSYRWAK